MAVPKCELSSHIFQEEEICYKVTHSSQKLTVTVTILVCEIIRSAGLETCAICRHSIKVMYRY
jgi:hypothetical protein